MSNKYFEVVGTIDGETEVLYGSFARADCTAEINCEKDGWKDCGYKAIKITTRETENAPDPEIYPEELVTSHQLWIQQAPSFNFEKNEEQLLAHGLKVGFVTKVDGVDDQYMINMDYEGWSEGVSSEEERDA